MDAQTQRQARALILVDVQNDFCGGGFPGVTTAPVVYNAQVEIRQLIIDWVTANKVIDPSTFSTYDWRLTAGGEPVIIEGASEGSRH